MFEQLFTDPRFKPDHLKIYPTATIKGTGLYRLWQDKRYIPYSDNELKSLLKEIKKSIPRYVRIQRLIRDIPVQNIEAGTKVSNMRDIIAKESVQEGWSCNCIRCREVKGFFDPDEKLKLFREDYEASDGKEIFLSFRNENQEKLYSLLRLRISSQAIIRELHTYGKQLAVRDKKKSSPQHRGLGKRLVKEAEKIVLKESSLNRISVISAVGVRGYYRKLGYRLNKTYMVKRLR